MTLTQDLALESHQLKAGDVEQTDVAAIHRNESFFRQLRQRSNGIGSIHITQRSQFTTREMRQDVQMFIIREVDAMEQQKRFSHTSAQMSLRQTH